MKSIVCLSLVVICVISGSSAAGIPKPEVVPENKAVEPREYHGVEAWSGPGPVFFAPVIALAFVLVLWIAAYNTIRDAPPRFGYAGGVKPLERISPGVYPEAVVAASHQVGATVAASARAFDQLTHRVLSSIEKLE